MTRLGGGAGNDFLAGDYENAVDGFGNDTIYGEGGDDLISGWSGNDYIDGGSGENWLDGKAGNDTIIGGDGGNFIDGGPGDDLLMGGSGPTIYVVDSAGDVINGETTYPSDPYRINAVQVDGDITYTLAPGQHIQYLSAGRFDLAKYASGVSAPDSWDFSRTKNASITGNELGQVIDGNAGSNLLSGAGGDDTLVGRSGMDTLDGGDGVDTADYSYLASTGLGINVTLNDATPGPVAVNGPSEDVIINTENVIGSSGADVFFGNMADNYFRGGAGADMLTGLGGNDILDGGEGGDYLSGGVGSDIYIVDSVSDNVVEATGEGLDIVLVKGGITYAIAEGKFIEILAAGEFDYERFKPGSSDPYTSDPFTSDTTENTNLTGNSLGQQLRGNAGDNILIGAGGNDALSGGAGSDTADY